MCLKLDRTQTEECQNQSGTIAVYKVYIRGNGKLRSPFYYQSVLGPGEINSYRKTKDLKQEEIDSGVNEGLHVFLDRETANRELDIMFRTAIAWMWQEEYVLVELEAEWKDLIAMGACHVTSIVDTPSAAFMKLTLKDEEWQKIWQKK